MQHCDIEIGNVNLNIIPNIIEHRLRRSPSILLVRDLGHVLHDEVQLLRLAVHVLVELLQQLALLVQLVVDHQRLLAEPAGRRRAGTLAQRLLE